MLPALDADTRRVLTLWSVFLCGGSLMLAPLSAHSSNDTNATQESVFRQLDMPDLTLQNNLKHVTLLRDPFAADIVATPDPTADPASMAAHAAGSSVGTEVMRGTPLSVPLPPNRGAFGMLPVPSAATADVRAVIIGEHPQALVADGTDMRIVGIGDRVDGHLVSAISSDGLRLDDGSMRRLSEEHQP